MLTEQLFWKNAFSRNIGLLTEEEQYRLRNARVAIPGMGGVGGVHLMAMVRTGIGNFNLADFDAFEIANFNRQYGASTSTVGHSKLDSMKKIALDVNPYIKIKSFSEGISESNIDTYLENVDVVLDGLDFFEFETRRLLFKRARENGTYVITAGPLGFSCAMLIFSPHEGMSFDEYFNITEDMSTNDKYISFAMGLAPFPTHLKYMDLTKVDLNKKSGPSLGIACNLCAAMASTEAVRIILNKSKIKPVPHYCQFDPFTRKFRNGKLYLGNKNPIQIIKKYVIKKILTRLSGLAISS